MTGVVHNGSTIAVLQHPSVLILDDLPAGRCHLLRPQLAHYSSIHQRHSLVYCRRASK